MTAPSVADILTGDLPDTASFTARRWQWAPAVGDELDPRDGTLTIWQTPKSGPPECDVYAVEEQAPPIGAMGRVFLAAKLNGENEVYEVLIGPTSYCSCKAGSCRWPACKHRSALAALCELRQLLMRLEPPHDAR